MPSGVVDNTYYYANPAMPIATGDYGSGVILPSSEAHFFDFIQSHVYNNSSGINATFPSASSGIDFASGLLRTYGESPPSGSHNGFYYAGLSGPFSKYGTVPPVTDFSVFNPYIHHSGVGGNPLLIHYVSDYIVSSPYNPYSLARFV